MGRVLHLFDRLTNVMSGLGTTADPRTSLFYAFRPLTGPEAESGYRSSWLVRKIVDVPAIDMTREWRDWQAEGEVIDKLEAEEKRLQLKAKCQRALILARLFGGSALILGTSDTATREPLNLNAIKAGGLTYVHVMSRWQISEGQARLDPADPWFMQPDFYTITGGNGERIELHPSRVVSFIGQKAPEGSFYPSASWLWGDPIMQSIGEAVKNADLAQSGFASLIERASVDIVKFKGLMSIVGTTEGEAKLTARLSAMQMGKSTWRAVALDAEDEWDQMEVNWSGIPNVLDAFLLVVAGAADIPMTRLLGQSPRGLQSTGDGEERDYQSMLRARQGEVLRPALEKVDEVLIRSALGNRPDDIYFEFAPLDQPDQEAAATVEKTFAEAVQLYATTGLLPDPALAAIAKNRLIESGQWPGSETAFEEAEAAAAAEPDPADDPNQLTTLEERVAAMEKAGTVTKEQAGKLVTDAAPRTLYVSRKLLNADALVKWAKAQGFETTVQAGDMHVTITFSREPVDWMKMGSAWDQEKDGSLRVPPGGARLVDRFGDAIVLLFSSSALSWRHEDMKRNGASFDFDQFQPHVTITYDAPADLDLSAIEPFRGELVFGPEIFAEVKDDWEQSLTEE
ncbi:MAG: anti-CBASS protein Acb1 family protein [Methylocystis sp.]|uniref:phage portal protein n=1 Tax=Methylocystis sp. TaxID=1911079 RepID=UPI003DA363EA